MTVSVAYRGEVQSEGSSPKLRSCCRATIRRRHSSASWVDMLPQFSNTLTNQRPSRISSGVSRAT